MPLELHAIFVLMKPPFAGAPGLTPVAFFLSGTGKAGVTVDK
jgi:hypothetical protein